MRDLTQHWNKVYLNSDDIKLGWYETDHTQTEKFIHNIPDWNKSNIFIAGAGTSEIIDILLASGANLVINDLSSEVIGRSKKKYNKYRHKISWHCHDLSKEVHADLTDVDIWIDRAVLHFLVDDEQVHQYFANVNAVVKPGGYALFAEFSKSGVTRCAGLDVRRYNLQDFENNLPLFQLITSEEYTYLNPGGESRPYIYALFKKNMSSNAL